ncbi:28S ribosomal protein S9, mitochondrial-like [Mizuhopecten yessoensis]|uniref:28S ribosomal protein S9, mitochondrial-like n=1 Tax=Mizuhopecten yessoensis TaxID=6573 RepID=UPI000B45D515|nr:28S ribosomal protein S9, mitochondrial-like [Mizuhopecten yessoensis]
MAASSSRLLAWRQLLKILSNSQGTTLNLNSRCGIHCSGTTHEKLTVDPFGSGDKARKISNAMKAYLETAVKYENQKDNLTADYDLGRRHLANMMGIHHDDFTKEHAKIAVRYLMPSGMFDKRAHPHLLEADEVLPHKKKAQFGRDGRPFHPMFYTTKPNYYQFMHDIVQKIQNLDNKMDESTSLLKKSDPPS